MITTSYKEKIDMADITTEMLREVSNESELGSGNRNFLIIDSDTLNETAKLNLDNFSDIIIKRIANRLAEAGLLGFIEQGVQLSDFKEALIDSNSELLTDKDGELII